MADGTKARQFTLDQTMLLVFPTISKELLSITKRHSENGSWLRHQMVDIRNCSRPMSVHIQGRAEKLTSQQWPQNILVIRLGTFPRVEYSIGHPYEW
jgi:hypothetical protein